MHKLAVTDKRPNPTTSFYILGCMSVSVTHIASKPLLDDWGGALASILEGLYAIYFNTELVISIFVQGRTGKKMSGRF